MAALSLRTERLRLEPVGDAHLPLLVELNADPEVMGFILGRAASPQETAAEWSQRRDHQSDAARGLGYWVGFVDDAFVGWWSASSFAADPSRSGTGYRLGRAAWGQGLATEGARAMVLQAFVAPSVERVVASTMAVNTASRRVLEKAGLVHVDTSYDEWRDPLPGADQGEVVYELTRAAWSQGSAGPSRRA